MMKMKRLLCIVSCMNAGGAETFLMKIYRNLNREKYQMDFCVNGQGLYDDEIKEKGGRIFIVPPKSKNPFKTFKAIKNIVKENKYNYVIRVNEHSLSTLDLLAAKRGGAKNLIMRSSNAATLGKFNTFLHKLFFFMPRIIPTVKIAPSKKAAEYTFGKKAVKNNKINILHNSLKTADYKYSNEGNMQVRDEFNLQDKFVIGHIGRFNYQKNHTFIIDVFKHFCERNDKARLLLVGQGERIEEIKKYVRDLKIEDRVIFAGVRKDVRNLLSAMDVFLFPSFFEGLPNTVVEAQTCGLPCLIADTITEEVAITSLVEFKSLKESGEAWANKLVEMSDSEKKERQAFAQDVVLQGYEIEQTVRQFEEIIFENKYE